MVESWIPTLASSEAELANREIDIRRYKHRDQVVDLRNSATSSKQLQAIDKLINSTPHNSNATDKQIKQELKVKERDDRLGLHRGPPDISRLYWNYNPTEHEKEIEMVDEQARGGETNFPYPFGDAQLIYAFYANDKRDVLKFFLRMPDDRVDGHTIDKSPVHDAAWHWIRRTFTEDMLNSNTRREIEKINGLREKEDSDREEHERKAKQEELFQAKLQSFELPIVNESKYRELKSGIRKATTLVEVNATVAAIYALSYLDKEKAAANEQAQ